MKLLVFLIIGLPLAFAIWLIVRIIQAHSRIEELSRRQDDLELEIIRLKRGLATTVPTPATNPQPTANAVPSVPPTATTPEPETATEIIPPPLVPPMPELPPDPAIPAPPVIPKFSAPPETETIEPFKIAEPEFFPTQSPTKVPPPLPALAQVDEPVITETTTPPPPLIAETEAVPPATPPPAEKKESIEMRIGTYWTVRVGIFIILTSLVFAANSAYQNIVPKLGPGGKLFLLYLASGLLLGAGAWWQRRAAKATLKNYAQVLFAGGLAAVYFTTYAGHHFRPLCVITSAVVDGTLLLAWAGVILWIADRRKSEVMALFAVGLAFYSSVITRVGDFTLYSNLVLTLTAVGFLLRNRWAGLSCASLVMSYAGYAFWRFLHTDGWRWATPDESLNFGAAFLASYWLIFTVATFVSKSEKLTGPNRAAFLSFNNGAFFALFLLTMLQVHSGGFWKFALSYGTVLLALSALARKTLPGEPLVKNTYLTQGLLLVTLGFITKFAGYQLALVLGVESVMLYIMGTQRPSLVLKFFAYAAALLALGWDIASLQSFTPSSLWTSLALGVFMGINAGRAHWLEKTFPSGRLETTAFTLLAFASWAAATWSYTLEPHLPVTLVLGVESIVLFNFVARRQSETPKIFAYLVALIAVVWAAVNLGHFDHAGLWIGTMLGGLMLVNAYWAHRNDQENTTLPLRTEPTLFTLLAFACWLAATWFNSTAEYLPLVLAAEAVILTLSIYVLRLREVTLLGQFFLVLAQVAWFGNFLTTTPPWWNPLALIAVTIGLSHWWQKQQRLAIPARFSAGCQSIFALASVGLVLAWLHPQVHAPTWLVLTSLLAVAVTVYGVVSRAWPLAICAQIFLAVSAWEFFAQVWTEKPDWFFPLAPVAGLLTLSLAALGWLSRRPDTTTEVRQPILKVALVYRWIALAMSLSWLWQYVPARQHVGAFMGAAIAVFALAGWKRNREALIGAAVYAVAALLTLWAVADLKMDAYWLNLLSLLSLLVMQQIIRRCPERFELSAPIHNGIICVAGLSLWRLLGCWVTTSGIFLTMSWAGFAVVFFVAGICLRERFHRWLGLGVLAAAVGRVVLVDVWKQATIYRVLTFMALGVALLVVGFIYNKYQETIRKWL